MAMSKLIGHKLFALGPELLGAFRVESMRHAAEPDSGGIVDRRHPAILAIVAADLRTIRDDRGPHCRRGHLRDGLKGKRLTRRAVLDRNALADRRDIVLRKMTSQAGLGESGMSEVARTPRSRCRRLNSTANRTTAVLEPP